MNILGHLRKNGTGAEPYEMFCSNLAGYISRLDDECPQNSAMHVELRNLVFSHFVATYRLIDTAIKDDPVLCEFEPEFSALSSTKYLHIIGLMHAFGAEKCYTDSPRTLSLMFRCISAAYALPGSIVRVWQQEQVLQGTARFRADAIAEILGRPEAARRLAPSLNVVDSKTLLYLAFLTQETALPDSIHSELKSS